MKWSILLIFIALIIGCKDQRKEPESPKVAIVNRQQAIKQEIRENNRRWDSIRFNRPPDDTANPFFQYAEYWTIDTTLKMEFDSLELELKKY